MKKTSIQLSAEESKLLTRVMTLGTGTSLPVVMSPSELAKLIGVIYWDTEKYEALENEHPGLWKAINPGRGYYGIPDDWFTSEIALEPGQHVLLMKSSAQYIDDFATYLRCLSELHKRRRKYSMILAAQPMPTMVQVSPRALMEYGHTDSEALASWLTWRKFFYDLDNRSAQETGYLFEPILAAAIGGEPKGAKTKVVRRTDDETKGRQVDCWKVLPDGTKLAYEFKLRVTIAASGQGRFAEELQFAEDCASSGAVPMLVVLDPTMNPRLAELQEAYRARGGTAYLGDAAWEHLEQEAGETMARFIERYVREPVAEISYFETHKNGDGGRRGLTLLDLEAKCLAGEIVLKLGTHERRITRREDASLADDSEEAV
jgi:hypothetical protein